MRSEEISFYQGNDRERLTIEQTFKRLVSTYMYICMSVHVCTFYVHVCTCMYMYVHQYITTWVYYKNETEWACMDIKTNKIYWGKGIFIIALWWISLIADGTNVLNFSFSMKLKYYIFQCLQPKSVLMTSSCLKLNNLLVSYEQHRT